MSALYWLIAPSSKGRKASCVALRWLQEIFIPEIARILAADFDGHVKVGFMWECKQNNVELLFIALDLGTFSPSSLGIERKLPTPPSLTMLH